LIFKVDSTLVSFFSKFSFDF